MREGKNTTTSVSIKSPTGPRFFSTPVACIIGYSLSSLADYVVPKNNAGLSTHTDPGSPSTLKKSPTNLARSPVNGEVVAPHPQGGGVSSGHPGSSPAITICPTSHCPLSMSVRHPSAHFVSLSKTLSCIICPIFHRFVRLSKAPT